MIDNDGNITLNRAADFSLPFDRFHDAAKTDQIDLSALTVRLRVLSRDGVLFEIIADDDPTDPKAAVFHFTQMHGVMLQRRHQMIVEEVDGFGNEALVWSTTIGAEGIAA